MRCSSSSRVTLERAGIHTIHHKCTMCSTVLLWLKGQHMAPHLCFPSDPTRLCEKQTLPNPK